MTNTKDIVSIEDKNFEVYIDAEKIQSRIAEIAKQIQDDYKDKDPIFICTLNGAFMFTADLVRHFNKSTDLRFIRISTYVGLESSGTATMSMKLDDDIKGRDVIIIEDIIDSGFTLKYLTEKLITKQVASYKIASFLSKPKALKTDIKVDYFGFEIENDFVVGYGLDYNEKGRNLKSIYKITN